MAEDFDVVVIGSGAGGAPVAYELALAGGANARILVLEKGPRLRTQDDDPNHHRSDFKRDELFNAGPEKRINITGVANPQQAFYSSHVEPDLNDEPHLWSKHSEQDPRVTIEGYTAQVVGGGTQLYGAVSLRFAERDFQLRSARLSNLPADPYADPDVEIAAIADNLLVPREVDEFVSTEKSWQGSGKKVIVPAGEGTSAPGERDVKTGEASGEARWSGLDGGGEKERE